MITQQDLLAHQPLQRLGGSMHWFASTASTNGFLLDAAANLPDGAVAWAEHQTAGRGRRGRRWEAPRGASILLSVLLQEPAESPLYATITLAAALATRDAIVRETDVQPGLRWPNDLYVGDRKLGGVLAESRALADGRRALVVGIGLNCLQHAGHFPPELQRLATSLELESEQPVHRGPLAGRLLAALDGYLAAPDPGPWEAAWRQHSSDLGTRIALVEDGRQYEGTVVDLADGGHLVLQLDSAGRRAFSPQTAARVR